MNSVLYQIIYKTGGILLGLFLMASAHAQIITDVPPNKRNNRFLNDPSIISMRPGLSIAGFSNEGSTGLGLRQILNRAFESTESSEYETVSQILDKASNTVSLHPASDQVEYTTNILQYLAFEALASFILEQNGVASSQAYQTYGLAVREHASVMDQLTTALVTLARNDRLVRKHPGGKPFDNYLSALRSYNNLTRAIDLYLAIENAYEYYGAADTALLSESEKNTLMDRFHADIDILFNDGLKQEYDLSGNGIIVTEDELEAGNRPLKGYLALGYASMSAQTADETGREKFDSYISMATSRASEPASDDERDKYWMYQTGNGNRFWAEGPSYFDFVLKDAIVFWHAVRIQKDLDPSFDPFFNDWFLNPVLWLADLSTPDGSVPPLDDGNKQPIQSASLLRWSVNYGDEEIGRRFKFIYDRTSEYHQITSTEDQYFLVEAAIPFSEESGSETGSLTNFNEQQLLVRHTDGDGRKHYILLNGEKGGSITSGEGHEQPDQLQLLYYVDGYSFLTDPGYDSGNPQTNSRWNGYKFTNTMQYDAEDFQTAFGFVAYQNEGGLESPFASFAERRKISEHSEAELFFEEAEAAPAVDIVSGQVELNIQNPLKASAVYHRSVVVVKGDYPYLIDVNDVKAETGRNDFVMRYYGNSQQHSVQKGWFSWNHSGRRFESPSHRLFLYTAPLAGSYDEEVRMAEIQEVENRDANGYKQPYRVIRKSYLSNRESGRFATATILAIRKSPPFSEPELVSAPQDMRMIIHPLDTGTVDFFVFARDTIEFKRTLSIDSGTFAGTNFSLSANKAIGFSRLRMQNNNWVQDPDFAVNLNMVSVPDPPMNLTVSFEKASTGPAAVLTWDKPADTEVDHYEVWKQIRRRPDLAEEPAKRIGVSAVNEYEDISVTDLPSGQFEQRWFVKTVSIDSLVSVPSNSTDWLYFDNSKTPEEFDFFNPYPNPLNRTGKVKYQLAEQANVSIRVFDLLGRRIASVVEETQPAGIYTREWNASGLASGIYILRLTAESENGVTFQESVRVSIIK